MKKPVILILGSNGMLGECIFNYLNDNHINIFGTSRKGKLIFRAENLEKDFSKIIKLYPKIDFIINCIGITNPSLVNNEETIKVNSLLPLKLSELSKTYKFKIIHISTDAVYGDLSGCVTEKSKTSPNGLYSLSKLLGESESQSTVNIRTSIIGLSPTKKTGLVESILNEKNTVKGFNNQTWSGCTNLQLAKFCEYLIYKDGFINIRKKSNVINFAPLGPTSKYILVKTILKIFNKQNLLTKQSSKNTITRYLKSDLITDYFLEKFGRNIEQALSDLKNEK